MGLDWNSSRFCIRGNATEIKIPCSPETNTFAGTADTKYSENNMKTDIDEYLEQARRGLENFFDALEIMSISSEILIAQIGEDDLRRLQLLSTAATFDALKLDLGTCGPNHRLAVTYIAPWTSARVFDDLDEAEAPAIYFKNDADAATVKKHLTEISDHHDSFGHFPNEFFFRSHLRKKFDVNFMKSSATFGQSETIIMVRGMQKIGMPFEYLVN